MHGVEPTNTRYQGKCFTTERRFYLSTAHSLLWCWMMTNFCEATFWIRCHSSSGGAGKCSKIRGPTPREGGVSAADGVGSTNCGRGLRNWADFDNETRRIAEMKVSGVHIHSFQCERLFDGLKRYGFLGKLSSSELTGPKKEKSTRIRMFKHSQKTFPPRLPWLLGAT